jgi:hypothetical protein
MLLAPALSLLAALGAMPMVGASDDLPRVGECEYNPEAWVNVCAYPYDMPVQAYDVKLAPVYERICPLNNVCVDVPTTGSVIVESVTVMVPAYTAEAYTNPDQAVEDVCNVIQADCCLTSCCTWCCGCCCEACCDTDATSATVVEAICAERTECSGGPARLETSGTVQHGVLVTLDGAPYFLPYRLPA